MATDQQAVPTTALHILGLLLQIQQNLTGLQRDMRSNAQAWRHAMLAGADARALAPSMENAVDSYETRLTWISTLEEQATDWARVVAMLTLIGGSVGDLRAMIDPLRAAIATLGAADKSTSTGIIAACDAILSSVCAPASLWPE